MLACTPTRSSRNTLRSQRKRSPSGTMLRRARLLSGAPTFGSRETPKLRLAVLTECDGKQSLVPKRKPGINQEVRICLRFHRLFLRARACPANRASRRRRACPANRASRRRRACPATRASHRRHATRAFHRRHATRAFHRRHATRAFHRRRATRASHRRRATRASHRRRATRAFHRRRACRATHAFRRHRPAGLVSGAEHRLSGGNGDRAFPPLNHGAGARK